MRGIKILCVGKVKEKYFQEGIVFYVRQIRKKYPMEIVECEDEPTPEGASLAENRKSKKRRGCGFSGKSKRKIMSLPFVSTAAIFPQKNGRND